MTSWEQNNEMAVRSVEERALFPQGLKERRERRGGDEEGRNLKDHSQINWQK